jgi:hypothetical protein
MSAVNDVNHVNNVNDVQIPNPTSNYAAYNKCITPAADCASLQAAKKSRLQYSGQFRLARSRRQLALDPIGEHEQLGFVKESTR